MKSPHWIAPKGNGSVPAWQKWLYRSFPASNRIWRYWLALKLDLASIAFRTSAPGKLLRSLLERSLADYMRRKAPAKYHDILIPSFDYGTKRPVLDHGYLCIRRS